jgi:hypothetical protein
LLGQWHYSLLTDKLSATKRVAKQLYSLAKGQNDSAQMIAAYRALAGTHHFLGDFESSRQYAMSGIEIWRSGSVQSHKEDLDASAVACLCYKALSEWHFGEISSAHANMAEAISLAKEMNNSPALAGALHLAAILRNLERNTAEVERLVSELIELSTRYNFALTVVGEIFGGNAAFPAVSGRYCQDRERNTGYRAGPNAAHAALSSTKAEALHLANRKRLNRQYRRQKQWSKDLKSAGPVPNCTGCAGVFHGYRCDEVQIEASSASHQHRKGTEVDFAEQRAERTYTEYRRKKRARWEGMSSDYSLLTASLGNRLI